MKIQKNSVADRVGLRVFWFGIQAVFQRWVILKFLIAESFFLQTTIGVLAPN